MNLLLSFPSLETDTNTHTHTQMEENLFHCLRLAVTVVDVEVKLVWMKCGQQQYFLKILCTEKP